LVVGRRPTLWMNGGERQDFYKALIPAGRHLNDMAGSRQQVKVSG